jgi:hypothetical protein
MHANDVCIKFIDWFDLQFPVYKEESLAVPVAQA